MSEGLDHGEDGALTKRPGGGRLRRVSTHALTVLGVLAVVGGAALGQIRRGLFDSNTFANRLAGSLDNPRVSAYVADAITGAVLREKPDLVAVRPILLSTAEGVVSSDPFKNIVRVTAREAHAAMLSKGGRNLLLSVPDAGVVLRGALANASPALADRIPLRISTAVANLGGTRASQFIVDMWQVSRRVAWMAGAGVLGGLLLLIAGIAIAPRRAQALRRASLDLALAGLVLLLLLPAGRALVSALPDTPLAQQAVGGLYEAFTRGLRRLALTLGGVGLVFSAAAHSLVGRAWLPETVRSAWAWLACPPVSTVQHLVRGALFLVAGVFLILRPGAALATAAVAAGALLAFSGLQALFRLALRAPREEHALVAGAMERFADRRRFLMLAAAGALAAAIAWLARPREPAIVRMDEGCNGDGLLCGRRLDEVVFPATHNSMAAADMPGFMFAAQERGVTSQLDDGVRAFLIDAHAGIPVSGRVKTEISGEAGFMREMQDAVGKEGLEAAMRIRERLVGPPDGPRALYLCHGFCELGALPVIPWLRTVREFLAANPHEVVILVIEDYVSPGELATAFADSGLADLVYRGAPRPPWPTLEEMAAAGQRVVTFLESGRPGVDWLYPAFEAIQETPFRFLEPSQFSCAPSRGGTAGSLFQINHWIETAPAPKPSNAAIVNAYDFLLGRARKCEKDRSRRPNILAVDFYRTGDVMRVARTLNGLDLPEKR